ncbi:MAG: FMN-binding protein [Jatrophihabitantaceae bacterium]
MKRIIFSITGTVLGLVALLSFKSHGNAIGAANGLPSAALPGTRAGTSATPHAAGSTGAPPTPSPTPTAGTTRPAPSPASQSVLGTAVQTRYGVVQVRISLSGSKITNVSFAQLTADDATSQQINSQAAPILLQQTLSAQSAQIDGVSGASYTSQGYDQSLQSALDKAGVH